MFLSFTNTHFSLHHQAAKPSLRPTIGWIMPSQALVGLSSLTSHTHTGLWAVTAVDSLLYSHIKHQQLSTRSSSPQPCSNFFWNTMISVLFAVKALVSICPHCMLFDKHHHHPHYRGGNWGAEKPLVWSSMSLACFNWVESPWNSCTLTQPFTDTYTSGPKCRSTSPTKTKAWCEKQLRSCASHQLLLQSLSFDNSLDQRD